MDLGLMALALQVHGMLFALCYAFTCLTVGGLWSQDVCVNWFVGKVLGAKCAAFYFFVRMRTSSFLHGRWLQVLSLTSIQYNVFSHRFC